MEKKERQSIKEIIQSFDVIKNNNNDLFVTVQEKDDFTFISIDKNVMKKLSSYNIYTGRNKDTYCNVDDIKCIYRVKTHKYYNLVQLINVVKEFESTTNTTNNSVECIWENDNVYSFYEFIETAGGLDFLIDYEIFTPEEIVEKMENVFRNRGWSIGKIINREYDNIEIDLELDR